VAIVLLLCLCLWQWQDHRKLAASTLGAERGPLWPLLFDGNRQTLVVCAIPRW